MAPSLLRLGAHPALQPAPGLLTALLLVLAPALPARAAADPGLVELRIAPSRTDPAIKTFDQEHHVFVHRGIVIEHRADLPADRRQLLLFIPGTAPAPMPGSRQGNGEPAASEFCRLAARLGYHVIYLRYPNATSASICARDEDPAEFERFRLAIIRGGASRHLSLPRSESIEFRTIKLLEFLQRLRPREAWSEFLHDDGSIRWASIAVAGQSQGGGHAALIATQHLVARVVATGAPKDFSLRHNRPAAWLSAPSVTPKSRYFCFNHVQDRQAADYPQQLANLRALQLDALGSPINVDVTPAPFQHSRILFTDYPGGKKLSSREAHGSVISSRHAQHFAPVWRYMLTEAVK